MSYSDLLKLREVIKSARSLSEQTEEAYVAFLDMLGFRSLLDTWPVAVERYLDAMELILGQALVNNQLAQRVAEYPELADFALPREVGILVLSDAVIISAPRLEDVVSLSSLILRRCLLHGIYIRGCIARGNHIQMSSGPHHLLISQAVRSAYEGESKLAKFPRVVIEPGVIRDITNLVEHLLAQDEDNLWFVHPFPYWLDEAEESSATGMLTSVEARLREHQGNQNLLEKYYWLADLLNVAIFGRADKYFSEQGFRSELRERLGESDYEPSLRPIRVWDYGESCERRFILPYLPNGIPKKDGIVWQISRDSKSLTLLGRSFSENWTELSRRWREHGRYR